MAEPINNGGPAFPVNSDNYAPPDSAGMSLRDYFAAKAMQGFVSSYEEGQVTCSLDDIALDAYKMADAMLKAREGGAE